MRGSAVVVRQVGPDDLDTTRGLWQELSVESSSHHELPDLDALLDGIRDRMRASDRSVRDGGAPTYRLAIATTEAGEVAGMLSVRVVDAGPLVARPSTSVDLVHVRAPHRRAGVGQALMGEVVRFSRAVGAQDVCVHVPTSAREANRFYARLGFAPRTVRRGAPLATLQRELEPEPVSAIETSDLTQLQRLLRRRAVLGSRMPRPARPASR